jgi:hypothetical protein
MPPPEPVDPLRLFQLLAQAGVPFVIIGGHAVTFHGYVRTTEDADIIWQRSAESEPGLLAALQSIHACWVSDELDPTTKLERLVPGSAAPPSSQHLSMLATDLGFLDIYDYVPGFPEVPVATLFRDSLPLGDLRFVSLAWLRRLKERAARHKDLDDLEHLPPG